ncbi:MAG TPA: deoxyribonuclease V [Desulfobacterales bacterium]|mgnify:CR=1 FL=1|nr:deoxyribonuclease V [Desulfobacterales bacterium]
MINRPKILKHILHPWNVSPGNAIEIQKRLAGHISRKAEPMCIRSVGGMDVCYREDSARAAVVVMSYPELDLLDSAVVTESVDFPYVPGLLSFREGPVILKAIDRLNSVPDLLIFDGHGIAHPRRFGIASHIGLLLNIPSIGCAKTRLCGHHSDLNRKQGSYSFLADQGETIGAVLRTRADVKPLYVSIGHRIDLSVGIRFVLTCCRGYRLPETTRLADRLARF